MLTRTYKRDRRTKMATFRGDRMKEHRLKLGFETQDKLAQELNVPQQYISRWETGEREPDNEQLVKLATILKCSTDYLLGLVDTQGNELLYAWRTGGWESAGAIIFERLSKQLSKGRNIPR